MILCFVTGNNDPFIECFSYVVLLLFPPILYLSGIFYLAYSIIKKEANIIISIILSIFATAIFLLFYILAIIAVIIG